MAPIPTNKGISRFFRTPGIPLLRDPKVRSIFFQSTAVLFLLWVIFTIANNTNKNLEERGIKTGFHFFDDIAPFAIPEKFFPFWSFELGESLYWEVLVIGIQNTVFISILGIISAAVLGFVVGVLRLSPNWLVSRFVGLYIEWFRNTPLLLQLLFWNFVVFLPLAPVVRNSWTWGEMFFLNKAGLYYPSPQFSIASAVLLIAALVSAIVAIVFMCRWAQRRKDTTGKMFPVFFVSLAIIAAFLSTGVFLAGEHLSFNYPQLKGLNYRGGGRVPLTAFVLWFGLTVYTAAFIAENVRGGILAVSHGQSEAASSLGLYRRITLQLIIIPQAMRVIVPPTISQFLNLTKNSSLAVAVGYPDLVNVWSGIALNQTGQALVIMMVTIGVYWLLSFLTSALLNAYNRRVQLEER